MTSYVTAGAANGQDLYWYHGQIIRELQRLDVIGELPMPVKAIAGNVQAHSGDVLRWADELAASGIVTDGEPRWEYPGRWLTLTDAGRKVTV